ncbi:MAG: HDOD domain-containing protein [Gemmatimonadales bacterium]
MRRPNCTVQEVTDFVMQDDAIAAKVLQVVNSAYFGLAQPVTGLHDAVAYLGLNTLRTLVLSVEAFRLFGRNDMCPGFDPAAHHGHVLLTARIATQLMDTMEDREDALTGALLHDIGKLLLASRLPARYSSVMARLKTRPVPSERAELEEGLPGHAAVGAHLLSLWGLPAKVVDMVAHHHDTAYLRSGGWGPAVAVHVADVLVHEQMVRLGREPAGLVSADLPALLTALGRMGDYPAWQELTADEATRVDGEEEIL